MVVSFGGLREGSCVCAVCMWGWAYGDESQGSYRLPRVGLILWLHRAWLPGSVGFAASSGGGQLRAVSVLTGVITHS